MSALTEDSVASIPCSACRRPTSATRVDMSLIDRGESDQMKYEFGLTRHYPHRFLTFDQVCDEAPDFRDSISFDQPKKHSAAHGRWGVLCEECEAASRPPEPFRVRNGEICLGVVSVELFDMLKLETKRCVPASSDDGTPLSHKFCEAFAQVDEVFSVLIRKGELRERLTLKPKGKKRSSRK